MSVGERAGGFEVRAFALEDAAAVEEIARKSPEAACWTRKSYETMGSAGERAWVIADVAGVAGFVVVRQMGVEGEILNLAVNGTRRRAGLGTALLDSAVGELLAAGVRQLFLEVRESNGVAIAFYEQQGFATTGRRVGYYREPEEAAICMRKIITG